MEYTKIIEGIEEQGIFDFVANNYHLLSKEELKDICMEVDYACYDEVGEKRYKMIKENAIDSLKEMWFDED